MRPMAALVRLVIDGQRNTRTVRFCDLLRPGELIQLGDGTRVVVETVEPCHAGDTADAEAQTKLVAPA